MNPNDPAVFRVPVEKLLPAVALAVALLTFPGCRTKGYQESDAAALDSQVAVSEIQLESAELDATLGALNDLVNQPETKAEPQFLKFSEALDRLAAAVKRAGDGVKRMSRKRDAYFEIWDKEIATISNPEIRQVSESRRTEVSDQFEKLSSQYDDAQNKLSPLIEYLKDIRKSLSADLTRQGLAATQPSVAKANERAGEVRTALTQSATDLDTLSARIASFRVQEVK